MGNDAWSGYSKEDKRQADMEKGLKKRDKGFYGHMKRKGYSEPRMIREYYEKDGCGITNPSDELSEGHL